MSDVAEGVYLQDCCNLICAPVLRLPVAFKTDLELSYNDFNKPLSGIQYSICFAVTETSPQHSENGFISLKKKNEHKKSVKFA